MLGEELDGSDGTRGDGSPGQGNDANGNSKNQTSTSALNAQASLLTRSDFTALEQHIEGFLLLSSAPQPSLQKPSSLQRVNGSKGPSSNSSSAFESCSTIGMINLRQCQAATTIQRAYRLHLAQKELKKLRLEADRKNKAACTIQKYYRGYKGRKERQKYQKAAIVIQSRIRGFLARRHYQEMRRNALQHQQNDTHPHYSLPNSF